MLIRSPYLAAIALSIGCVTGKGAPGLAHDPNVITEQEIAAINVDNAYNVVERLRPQFFRARGRTTVIGTMSEYANVFLGSHLFGDIASLRTITANQVQEIRYYNSADASLKFGMPNSKGVIQVKLK